MSEPDNAGTPRVKPPVTDQRSSSIDQAAPTNDAADAAAALRAEAAQMLRSPGSGASEPANAAKKADSTADAALPSLEISDNTTPPAERPDVAPGKDNPSKNPNKNHEKFPPLNPEIAAGVFLTTTQYPGVQGEPQFSSFPVALDGGTADVIDGERIFVSALHGVGDYQSHRLLGPVDFRYTDQNMNGELSQSEVDAQVQRFTDPHREITPDRQRTANNLQHVEDQFDTITDISQSFTPNAHGVTERGLEEYYRQNTHVTIHTPQGDLPATIIGKDREDDLIVFQVSGLSPEVERALGPNLPLAAHDAAPGDTVVAMGWRYGQVQQRQGEVGVEHPTHWGQHAVENSALTIAGMSGGPVVSRRTGEVIGLNHTGDSPLGSAHIPASEIRSLLQVIAQHGDR